MFEENQDVQFYLTCEITCSICSSKLLRLPVKYEIHTHTQLYIVHYIPMSQLSIHGIHILYWYNL